MYSLTLICMSISVLTFTIADDSVEKYDYDLIVLGGGSGGLAAAKEAHEVYKKRVLVVDYVTPSPQGTHWGEGGTCVNVGCIPKKLMHQASLIGEAVKDANKYGWEIKDPEKIKLNWATMRKAVQSHVKSVNWVTKTHLDSDIKKVTDYLNGLGQFVDEHTIEVKLRDANDVTGKLSSETKKVTGEKILIAVGGRPKYPEVEGVEKLAITSDDLFSLEHPPGKTLIIGAGYIGLECAGFLRGMGMDVTVMVRSKVLGSFDRQMADLVKQDLTKRGVKFLDKSELVSIAEDAQDVKIEEEITTGFFIFKRNKKVTKTVKQRCLRVKWKTETQEGIVEREGHWDTVLLATGRRALTSELKVNNAHIEVKDNGKIDADQEQTKIANIYAVGDVLYDKPELTPVAVQAGKLLMARLYGDRDVQMDYNNVATTVFTPQEYSFVGLSYEKAISLHSEDTIEVYHSFFSPVEYSIPRKGKSSCYLKVICKREGDQQILGFHYFGPSAGEVMQGYAAALKAGLTFKHLQSTVGIHPTASEEFTRVYITKRSEIDPTPQSCCS